MIFTPSIALRRQAAKQRDFLAFFASSGSILASAKQAGVSRQLVYYWRENSPSFADKLATAAGAAFCDTLPASPQGRPEAATRHTIKPRERMAP